MEKQEKKTVGLSGEYRHYNKVLKNLKKIHSETFIAIEDVIRTDSLSEEQISSLSATKAEIKELQSRIRSPMTIVIAGQDNYGKVSVLTKLLGVQLLPFCGTQHFCGSVNEQLQREDKHLCGSLRTNPSLNFDISSGKSSFSNNSDVSEKGNPIHFAEKPWRGIKLSYSPGETTYSVVRPDESEPNCVCETSNLNKIQSIDYGKRIIDLSGSGDIDPSADVLATDLFSATNEHSFTNFSCSSLSQANSVLRNGAISQTPDLSVSQLKALLDKKLSEEIMRKCNVSGRSHSESRDHEDIIMEIPLSEIELGNEHISDPILRDALLDVGFNHSLLKEQVQILITPTIKKHETLQMNKISEKLSKSFKKSSERISQIMKGCSDHQEENLDDDDLSDVSSAFEVFCDSEEECEDVSTGIELQRVNLPSSKSLSIPRPKGASTHNSPLSTHNTPLGTPLTPLLDNTHPHNIGKSNESFKSLPMSRSDASCLLLNTSSIYHSVKNMNRYEFYKHDKRKSFLDSYDSDVMISSSLPSSFEDPLQSNHRQSHLKRSKSSHDIYASSNLLEFSNALETSEFDVGSTFLGSVLPNVNAVIFYAITRDELSDEDITELKDIKSNSSNCPVMFMRVPPIQHCQSLSKEERLKLLSSIGLITLPNIESVSQKSPDVSLSPLHQLVSEENKQVTEEARQKESPENSQMIFQMDDRSPCENVANDSDPMLKLNCPPTEPRRISFADQDPENRAKKPPMKAKSTSKIITLGDCNEEYNSKDVERIEYNTALLYQKLQMNRDDIAHGSNHPVSSSSDSNPATDLMKYLDMPENILNVLSQDLKMIQLSSNSKCNYFFHSHLNVNDLPKNPFFSSQTEVPNSNSCSKGDCSQLCIGCGLINSFSNFNIVKYWIKTALRCHLSYTSQLLSKVQSRCLSSFVVFAFEFSRQLQITPKRLAYAKEQEEKLYVGLLSAARQKEEHIRNLITRTLSVEKEFILSYAEKCQLPDYSESLIQELVLKEINRRVGNHLVSGVQGLRDNCIGTLQRCLSQLEEDCSQSNEQPNVTHALKKLVNAAYQVEVRPTSSWGLLRGIWERIKVFIGASSSVAGIVPNSSLWQRQVAEDMIANLSEKRLARSVSVQLSSEIKSAHTTFLNNLELLENYLSNTLESTHLQQLQLKSVHAPKLARLALLSDSIHFWVNFGLPKLDAELGRGHFGVVYSCKKWGKFSPCAIKTIIPRDATQWRDIAMQYYYTRLMGHHERIVGIHACVIDRHFSGSSQEHRSKAVNQCVLLVMDVHKYDLHTAIKQGLNQQQVLNIAIDVVQGIRFLHSQGLIHRDIKPKNILLDFEDRAKVTDLDFCKPEAMITGSVVGTPIHMAPELFTGNYDSSVDVYAFGVLFWYLCSGKTNMPRNFCIQKSKEELKLAVFKGVRPECLSSFTPDCWALMEKCWVHQPEKRLVLGSVEEKLQAMLLQCQADSSALIYQKESPACESDGEYFSGMSSDGD